MRVRVEPKLITALERLDPSEPARPDWYIERGTGWISKLLALSRAGRRVRALLHGSVGAGKTTELQRAAESLSAEFEVIHVSVIGGDPIQNAFQGSVRRQIATWAGARDHVDLLYAVQDIESLGDARRWATPIGDVLRMTEARAGRPIVLLVDGLDLWPTDKIMDALKQGSELAAGELPAIVYAMPNAALSLLTDSRRDQRFQPIEHVAPICVLNPDLSENQAGVELLVEGLTRRIGDLEIIDDPGTLLRRVALLSGGVPRDAIRILQAAVLAAMGSGRVTSHHIQEGARELRQDLEQGLNEHYDIDTLMDVKSTLRHMGAAHLIAQNAILPYDGAERRYWLPHPLLWPMLDTALTRRAG